MDTFNSVSAGLSWSFTINSVAHRLTGISGDLHDGAGLSDATSPNGQLSNPIFEKVDYDLLTIGNHELYVSDIAYETFNQFAKHYGDKYLTSNVQIINPATGQYEYIGKQYRYFTTDQGYRIMAVSFLVDMKQKIEADTHSLAFSSTSQATAMCPKSSKPQIWSLSSGLLML